MNNQPTANNPRTALEQKYNSARTNLLIMLGLTIINIVLLFTKSDVMLLFSATIPYLATAFGIGIAERGFSEISVALFGASGILIILYLLCWIFSKKHYGWMIAALALFVLDTATLILFYLYIGDFSGILDLVIHIAVLFYLISGVVSGNALKKLHPEFFAPQYNVQTQSQASPGSFVSENTESDDVISANSPIIRHADLNVKFRILIEANYNGHQVCYRRVKRVNELVIDGYVYDEVEMLVEGAHSLNARIDNQNYQVGFDGAAHSYFKVDGVQVAKKLRLW